MRTSITQSLIASSLLLLISCGGGSDPTTIPIFDEEQSSEKVVFSLGVSDAPVDNAVTVSIVIDAIKLTPVDDSVLEEVIIEQFMLEEGELSETVQINLLDYQGNEQIKIIDQLQNIELDNIAYQLELLVIDEGSYVELQDDGTLYPIKIPSSRLRLGEFIPSAEQAQVNNTPAYTIEFDLRQSLVLRGKNPAPNGYIIKPHGVRIVGASGSLSGSIPAQYTDLGACTVYLYSGKPSELGDQFNVEDDDFVGEVPTAQAPFATTQVAFDNTFSIGFVAPGEYTAALFCSDNEDDNTQFDGLSIPSPEGLQQQLTIEVGVDSMITF